jgi:uncharacterized Zn finger protein
MNRKPDQDAVEGRSEIETSLTELDRNQLGQVLLALAGDDSAVAARITALIEQLRSAAIGVQSAALTETPRPETSVDVKKLRREVRSVIRSAYGPSYSSWGPGGGVPDVGKFVDQAWGFIQAGHGNLALDVLEAVTAEYADEIENLADEGGETEAFLEHEIAPLWTEAVLAADLTRAQREDWASKLETWDGQLSEYGYDDTFDPALAALEQGWTDAALQRALRDEQREWGSWAGQNPSLSQALITARLNILERQGRLAEALNLARAAGQSARYASLLLQLGQVAEAVEAAQQHFTTAAEALAFARELREKWHAPEAMTVAERGLTLEGAKGELANWLVDLASELGKADLALAAAVVGFKAQMDLASYQRVQSLAGSAWTEYREDLLAHLRQPPAYLPSSGIDVFLYEQLVDDAIAAVDRSGSYDTIERVARAAVATQPDWVVRTCRSQAERITDAGKAQSYDYAIRWLEIARDAYRVLGQSKEWQAYLQGLIAEHARKYKLRPMLEKLR